MRMKNRYHIKGWPPNLVLIQWPEGLGNSLLCWVLHFLSFSETRLHQLDLIPSTKGTRDSVITAPQKKALNLNTPQDPRILRPNRFLLSHNNTRADPGFFLGGGALVSCSTSKPINHIVFFFGRILVVLENRWSSQGGVRTPCTLPLDPLLYEVASYLYGVVLWR